MADAQARLQKLSEEFTDLQKELQDVVDSRQRLEAQKNENLGVQKEFGKLKNDETIYKLIGPVLLEQDKTEAESTVNGRIEFIGKEISRLEKQIKDTQEKIEKKKGEIIQTQAAAAQGPPAGKQPVKA
ncbi:Prefoldin [Phialemonium atrogriseum]|uniref:Prefoldin n=1 Tax=Phialemonium atrogriseum TaxID=1093897 RepID=A0AAJ0FM39_9PEZI|nr:Prefoldin [Phialemonium atrogriseum]KAK1767399.1 Prefoldin [Phialemonium atrogriseum]